MNFRMRGILLILVLNLFSDNLFSQAVFDELLQLNKPNKNDTLIHIEVLESNEMFAFFYNDSVWTVLSFDNNGNISSKKEKNVLDGNYEKEKLLKSTCYYNNDQLYIIALFYSIPDLILKVYNYSDFSLISEIKKMTEVGSVLNSSLRIINYEYLTYIGTGLKIEDLIDEPGGSSLANYQFLYLFYFDHDLTYVNHINNCHQIFTTMNIAIGNAGGYCENEMTDPPFSNYFRNSWLYKVQYNTVPPSAEEIFHWKNDDTIKILNSDDYSNGAYGIVVFRNNPDSTKFICYNNDLSSIIWEKDFSYLRNSSNKISITASANLRIKDSNQYIVYFSNDQMEIRDRISGEIIHYEWTAINPFFIFNCPEVKTYFLTHYCDGYKVYSVEIPDFIISDVQINNKTQLNNFYLRQNYPNPFNTTTTIKYNLTKSGDIHLKIYNLAGQEIKTLVDSHQESGEYKAKWTAEGIPSGLYFYKLQAGEFSETKKLVLEK